jgi:hypothetical protein
VGAGGSSRSRASAPRRGHVLQHQLFAEGDELWGCHITCQAPPPPPPHPPYRYRVPADGASPGSGPDTRHEMSRLRMYINTYLHTRTPLSLSLPLPLSLSLSLHTRTNTHTHTHIGSACVAYLLVVELDEISRLAGRRSDVHHPVELLAANIASHLSASYISMYTCLDIQVHPIISM